MGILGSLIAELSPEWTTRHKELSSMVDPREDTDKTPMPDPNWKPEIEKMPLDPEEESKRDDGGDQPGELRDRHTPKR